jgi:hypothetical protein
LRGRINNLQNEIRIIGNKILMNQERGVRLLGEAKGLKSENEDLVKRSGELRKTIQGLKK